MNTTTLSIADSSGFIPQIWAGRALDVLRANIVLAKLVARDFDFEPGWQGKQLNIPYPGTFAAQSKSSDTLATLQTPSGGKTVTVPLSYHKYVDFLVEDFARAQATQDLMDRYVMPAVVALAEQLENDIFAQVTGFQTQVGAAGTDMTASVIKQALKVLDVNKAPLTDRFVVASPKDRIAILNDSSLATYFAYSRPEAIAQGSIGNLFGADFWMSQIDATASPSVNDVQTLTMGGAPTGGTFTLTFTNSAGVAKTTAGIAYNATAAAVQAALVALSNIGSGTNNCVVTGSAGGPWTVTFGGIFAGQQQTLMTASNTGLTGGTSPAVTIAHTAFGTTTGVAMHKNGIILAVRPFTPVDPGSGVSAHVMSDPASGLSIRVLHWYDMANRGHRVGFDILYGTVVLRPELGVQIAT